MLYLLLPALLRDRWLRGAETIVVATTAGNTSGDCMPFKQSYKLQIALELGLHAVLKQL